MRIARKVKNNLLKIRKGRSLTLFFGCLVQGLPGKPNQRKADSQAGSRIWGVLVNPECLSWKNSGRAKGAAKGSCGETVVQKGAFGESVSSLPP